MAPYLNNTQNIGYYVPTTNVWDIQQINTVDFNSSDFKELLVNLYQNLNKMSLAINARDNGMYFTQELVDNQQWFSTVNSTVVSTQRVNYRTTIDFGALPVTGTKSVPHNIDVTDTLSWTRIYGTATDQAGHTGIPIPYVDLAGNNIQIDVDNTNVNISTNSDYSNYTVTYVILEYLKS